MPSRCGHGSRRRASRESRSRPTCSSFPRSRMRRRRWACPRRTSFTCGTGSAAASRCGARSGCPRCCRSVRSASTNCWPAAMRWIVTRSKLRCRRTCRRPWRRWHFGIRPCCRHRASAWCPTTTACAGWSPWLQQLEMESLGKSRTDDGGLSCGAHCPAGLGRRRNRRAAHILPGVATRYVAHRGRHRAWWNAPGMPIRNITGRCSPTHARRPKRWLRPIPTRWR